jgi:hypothetical protein
MFGNTRTWVIPNDAWIQLPLLGHTLTGVITQFQTGTNSVQYALVVMFKATCRAYTSVQVTQGTTNNNSDKKKLWNICINVNIKIWATKIKYGVPQNYNKNYDLTKSNFKAENHKMHLNMTMCDQLTRQTADYRHSVLTVSRHHE